MADQDPRRVTLYPKNGGDPITVDKAQAQRLQANGWQDKPPAKAKPPAVAANSTTTEKGAK